VIPLAIRAAFFRPLTLPASVRVSLIAQMLISAYEDNREFRSRHALERDVCARNRLDCAARVDVGLL
jgi:hypothetical protein